MKQGRRTSDIAANPPTTASAPHADPQDLEFGKAAAEKEDALDVFWPTAHHFGKSRPANNVSLKMEC
jgi:hypothetical protein